LNIKGFAEECGKSFLAPENTLAAVNLAWELGSSFVEVDFHLSTDPPGSNQKSTRVLSWGKPDKPG
jgi:hypothetical protein